MKYFLDTEFLEGKQDKRFLGIKYGETRPTIDLISIGLVSSDNREYYAISKDFNLWEAWNRYDLKKEYPDDTEEGSISRKVYWIRENVLNPIFMELQQLERENLEKQKRIIGYIPSINSEWSYSNFKRLIKKHGKSNKEIAREINKFIYPNAIYNHFECNISDLAVPNCSKKELPIFYAYYADYDWVVFCQLFGKMIDLPKGFPKYCIDLKQIYDEQINKIEKPNNKNEHNALSDAKWNKAFYNLLASE